MTLFNSLRGTALTTLFSALLPASLLAWGGGPHTTVTRAALESLPAWQKELLGAELAPLGSRYCLIPDTIFTDAENASYAIMTNSPGVRYLKILHVPEGPLENAEVLRYFLTRAVDALNQGKTGEAARYAGTLVHVLEDWGCPAHAVPRDNMFTLFKQFLPPPETYRHTLLHGPLENGTFALDLAGYRPSLLGATPDEAAFHLLLRSQQATVHARGQVVPIIQALYANDTNAVNAAQQVAAHRDAQLVSDALYTLLCLGSRRVDAAEAEALRRVDLSQRFPLEAPDLYLPQSAFFGKPQWGHATAGVVLHNGQPQPLRLNVTQGDGAAAQAQRFDTGIGTGTRSVLSYSLPADLYARFTATVGLHADLGQSGQVTFEVSGNGRRLASLGPLVGTTPAQTFDVCLSGVTNLQLTATSAGGDGAGNYAIWAAPTLYRR